MKGFQGLRPCFEKFDVFPQCLQKYREQFVTAQSWLRSSTIYREGQNAGGRRGLARADGHVGPEGHVIRGSALQYEVGEQK